MKTLRKIENKTFFSKGKSLKYLLETWPVTKRKKVGQYDI